ncbi:hypothetical protein GCM10011351_30780 [Paraliobacillus quinghaiensis]|uniref:RsgI N-terminal anti-sigma domain-containing protein n=1 Tax=Paraliobacillus quinghaiensis TaxID=470815 RepID=A0A917WXM6_9BACI|nr:hypothetical protein [Paraliobacillus quinghaiensis]GGM42682.1 hypothetical protein GCM10011351_30780 [Paraliobacillus quinghaiensis]
MKSNTHQGIVVKVTDTKISLLCQDGNFKNIPRSGSEMPQIGEHYTYVEKNIIPMKGTKSLALVAVLFLMIAGYFMRSFMIEENSYLFALDINPSIEIYTNEDLQVTKVDFLNEEGHVIADSLENSKQDINVILEEVVASAVNKNYLSKSEKGMINLTVVSLIDSNHLNTKELQETLDRSLKDNSISADVIVDNGSKQLVEESREENLSINKMQLYKDLKDKGLGADELREKSIASIKKEYNHKTNDQKDIDKNEEKEEEKQQVKKAREDAREKVKEKREEEKELEKEKRDAVKEAREEKRELEKEELEAAKEARKEKKELEKEKREEAKELEEEAREAAKDKHEEGEESGEKAKEAAKEEREKQRELDKEAHEDDEDKEDNDNDEDEYED